MDDAVKSGAMLGIGQFPYPQNQSFISAHPYGHNGT
jgi:hypothetical protein